MGKEGVEGSERVTDNKVRSGTTNNGEKEFSNQFFFVS